MPPNVVHRQRTSSDEAEVAEMKMEWEQRTISIMGDGLWDGSWNDDGLLARLVSFLPFN